MNKNYIISSLLLLSACTSSRQPIAPEDQVTRNHYVWTKEAVTSTDFSKDLFECETGIQQRVLMATQAMNQYKHARMNMGVFGFGLEEPKEIDEDEIPGMLAKCLESSGWRVSKKTTFALGPDDDEDEVNDKHTYKQK